MHETYKAQVMPESFLDENLMGGGERERVRERERETDRQTDRQTDRDRDRETERDREKISLNLRCNHFQVIQLHGC